MKNIYVFTGNNTLYNTTIRDEIDDLRMHFNVIPIVEDEALNIDLSIYENNLKAYKAKNLLRIKFVSFFIDLYKLINETKKLFQDLQPDLLIVHAEDEIKTIIIGRLAKKISNAKIIRRIPTKLLSPQNDYLWLRRQRSLHLDIFIKFIKYYLILPLYTGRVYRSRQKWIPNSNNLINIKSPIESDITLCYSNSCKNILSGLGENAIVIAMPCGKKKIPIKMNVALYVPSRDWELLKETKRCSVKEALEFEYSVFKRIKNKLLNSGITLEAKFRDEVSQRFFKELEPKLNIIDYESDIYRYIDAYEYVIGYCSTVLLKQSLTNKNQKIISIALQNNAFYEVYKYCDNIYYVESKLIEEEFDLILNKKLKREKIEESLNLTMFIRDYLAT
jgi:hypothetical protein